MRGSRKIRLERHIGHRFRVPLFTRDPRRSDGIVQSAMAEDRTKSSIAASVSAIFAGERPSLNP